MKHRVGLVAAAAASLLSVGATSTASAATTGCSATYTVVSQWQGGFQGGVSFTNLGDPLTSWKLEFTFPAGQAVTQGWNATWTQSAAHVTAANMSWNGTVPTGASVALGFIGSSGGSNPAPTAFSVDGVTCTGSTTSPPATTPTTTPPGGAAPALKVSGKNLVTSAGKTYRLLGVNRSSAEFACVQGKVGVFDGADPDQASVDAMKTWNIHAVRIPINEQCWLGTYGTPSGAAYQQAVRNYATLLVANGINPIIDLHWSYGGYSGAGNGNCTDVDATCQKPMPDAQYAPQLWTSVATAFKGDNAVLFDLFNEPWPDNADGYASAADEWRCWRDGGTCGGIAYPVAGMQSLVDAVRGTGATNVIMLGGLAWSNDLTQWLAYKPADATGNLMAAFHVYNFNSCGNASCWDGQVAPVAAQVPVVAGEIGQNSCAHDFIDQVTAWADTHGVGYLAWTWNPWGCGGGNVLIQDYAGTPTDSYGSGFKAHLLTVNP